MIASKEFNFPMCARDADNLRAVKQTFNADGSVAKLVTSVRGGLDALADLTTNVNNSSSTYQPFQQKNYLYGPGGLIASELRGFYRSGKPVWQIYGSATGCNASATPAAAQNLQSTGYDLFLSFGGCSSATVKTLTLEWHELNADGTPRNCVASSMQTDATTNFNARYSCGILHLNPALGTETIFKLKYDIGYSVKATAHANLGLLGERDFVTGDFTVKLARGAAADQLAFVTNTSAATQSAAAPPPGPDTPSNGAGPRFVEYYQKDHLGTIRVVSNESGAVESTHDYEPFGLELPGQDPSDNTHRFTGHERDIETGLDYMKARYYGAGMGRFGAVDKHLPELQSIINWNAYTYVRNNPLIHFDPNGLDTWLIFVGRPYVQNDEKSGHNVGRNFMLGAQTRAREIKRSKEFKSKAENKVVIIEVGTGADLKKGLQTDQPSGPVRGVDIFAHSWTNKTGESGINLGEGPLHDPNKWFAVNVEGSGITKPEGPHTAFTPDATVAIHGCNAGATSDTGASNISQAIANWLNVPTSGSTSPTIHVDSPPDVHWVPQGGTTKWFKSEKQEIKPPEPNSSINH